MIFSTGSKDIVDIFRLMIRLFMRRAKLFIIESCAVFFNGSNTNIRIYDDCETTLKAENTIAKIDIFVKFFAKRNVVRVQKNE